jgi:hypothetical protein
MADFPVDPVRAIRIIRGVVLGFIVVFGIVQMIVSGWLGLALWTILLSAFRSWCIANLRRMGLSDAD